MTGFDDIGEQLDERKGQDLYRRRRVVESSQGRELVIDGKTLLNFCSNDYLGLAADLRVSKAFQQGANDWGVGSGGSHLITGHTRAHEELEEALAEFTGRPRCLVFSSGFAANMGTIAALLGRGDRVFEDERNHASLLDGGLLSRATFKRYAHLDNDDLGKKLAAVKDDDARKLIVSDGTFSMDGTTADIAGLVHNASTNNAWLMIDEAHSLGVLGRQGRGLVDANDFSTDNVQILIGTLGKAFGTQGGFVAGSAELIETLIQFARPYIYSTAMPSAVAVATLASLRIAIEEEWRRERLGELVKRFQSGAEQLGLALLNSVTPIQPVLTHGNDDALDLSAQLEERGILVTAIRPPTVPAGSSRLRITLMAEHTNDDVDQLLEALEQTTQKAAK
jgi:8-amino-7-oxononanoate synthase